MRDFLIKDKSGFTLVEVLIAIALLATALLALGALATGNMKAVEVAKRQTQAINLATEKIEMLEVISYARVGVEHGPDATINGNSLQRTCPAPVVNADGLPETICTPVDNTVLYDKILFQWEFIVYYLDFDNDGKKFLTGSLTAIDPGDIKKVVARVWWTDIYGYHEVKLDALRGKTT